MSFAQEVLQTLQAADGSMRNLDIREALGLDPGAESTTKISTALSNLITQGAIERVLEGGVYAYIAVPGWTPPKRGGGVPAKASENAQEAAEPEAPPQPPDAAQRLVQAVADGAQVVAEQITQADVDRIKDLVENPPKRRGRPPGKATAKRAPQIDGVAMTEAILNRLEAPSKGDDVQVTLSRRTLRLLAAGVLVFGDELGPDLRRAVREAVEVAT